MEDWKLEKIILGIRHESTFTIAKILGDIVDFVVPLQGQGAFPKDCFEKIENPDPYSLVLKDHKDILKARFNLDGVILECNMLAEPSISKENVFDIFSELIKKVIPLSEGKNKINRLGINYTYTFPVEMNAAQKLFSTLLKINLKGVSDKIYIRFALKNPASEAIYDPTQKADFRNVLFEIESKKEDEKKEDFPRLIKISIDYQYYYSPSRTVSNLDIVSFVSEAENYINKYVKKSELNF